MGGPTAYLRGMYKVDTILGGREVKRAVVATGGCGTTVESHAKRYLGDILGLAATGIRQTGWGRGRRGGIVLWK